MCYLGTAGCCFGLQHRGRFVDKIGLIAAIRELDRQLAEPVDLVIIGGAAMILGFGASRATRNVDVIPLRGDLQALRTAVARVGRDLELPSDWVSDAAKGLADVLSPDFYRRLEPIDLQLDKLRLYLLGRPDLVAMKIIALREQDLEDLEILLAELDPDGLRIVEQTASHVARFRPDWAQRIVYFLEERRWRDD